MNVVQNTGDRRWPLEAVPPQTRFAAALQAWYREHPITPVVARMISARAWRVTRNQSDGEDLRRRFEQDCLMAVCRAADTWEHARGPYVAWVGRALEFCTRRFVVKLGRRNRRWAETVWIDDSHDAAIDLVSVRGVHQMVTAIDVRACHAWLRGRDRRMFELFLDGRSPNEIRHLLNLPRTAFYASVWPTFVNLIGGFFHG